MTRVIYRWIRSRCAVVIALVLTLGAAVSAPALPSPEMEKAKINYLLHAIESLHSAQFIRNGTPHSSAEAAAHLRLKWQAAGSRVITAEDFIRECASKSSVSGVAYSIRFTDGRIVSSREYLQQLLVLYERER